MTKAEQKRAVAFLLMQQAGNLLESWGEREDTEDIDYGDAQQWLAGWLKDLPGNDWDTRLGPHPYEEVECSCLTSWKTVQAMRSAGHGDMYCDSAEKDDSAPDDLSRAARIIESLIPNGRNVR